MNTRHLALLVPPLSLVAATIVHAQPPAAAHVMLAPKEIQFVNAPAGVPAGAKMAVLAGDPAKNEMFIVQYKFPAGYKIPPHWHPTDEHITVLSGSVMMGMGDEFSRARMKTLTPGSHAVMPAKAAHYLLTRTATVIARTAIGPYGITYVNPRDDPRNR